MIFVCEICISDEGNTNLVPTKCVCVGGGWTRVGRGKGRRVCFIRAMHRPRTCRILDLVRHPWGRWQGWPPMASGAVRARTRHSNIESCSSLSLGHTPSSGVGLVSASHELGRGACLAATWLQLQRLPVAAHRAPEPRGQPHHGGLHRLRRRRLGRAPVARRRRLVRAPTALAAGPTQAHHAAARLLGWRPRGRQHDFVAP